MIPPSSSSTPTLASLILAGGNSSRMGQDKALIPWDGVPLLQRVFEAAQQCSQQVYILTPWPERYREILCDRGGFLQESNPGQGPLIAFEEGLRQLPAIDWILLLACDLPQLQPQILQSWIDGLPSLPSTSLAWVPRRDTLWEPLCGFYRPMVRSHLTQFIQQGGRSFQAWLSSLPAEAFPVGEEEAKMLRNCNCPEDLPG